MAPLTEVCFASMEKMQSLDVGTGIISRKGSMCCPTVQSFLTGRQHGQGGSLASHLDYTCISLGDMCTTG